RLFHTESRYRYPPLAIEPVAEQLTRTGKAIRHKLPRLVIIKDSVILTGSLVFSAQGESSDLKRSAYFAPILIQVFVATHKINDDLVCRLLLEKKNASLVFVEHGTTEF